MAWTPEQLQAINEEGKNIIVSAGAGSGKTAVLTERTIRKLKTSSFDQEFKYSFISLARSFLFNLPDDEIYHYYVTNTYKDSIIYL